jgi:hypothetical protein
LSHKTATRLWAWSNIKICNNMHNKIHQSYAYAYGYRHGAAAGWKHGSHVLVGTAG